MGSIQQPMQLSWDKPYVASDCCKNYILELTSNESDSLYFTTNQTSFSDLSGLQIEVLYQARVLCQNAGGFNGARSGSIGIRNGIVILIHYLDDIIYMVYVVSTSA